MNRQASVMQLIDRIETIIEQNIDEIKKIKKIKKT